MRVTSGVLIGIAVLGACSKKPELTPTQVAQQDLTQYQAEIRKIVKDSSRADSLVGMTNEFQRTAVTVAKRDSAALVRLGELNRDYTSTRAQFDSVYGAMAAARHNDVPRLLALRTRMTQVATPAEWEQLKSARLKMTAAELELLEF
jgi:hypothetical protein